MRFCQKCGLEIKSTGEFCINCGNKLIETKINDPRQPQSNYQYPQSQMMHDPHLYQKKSNIKLIILVIIIAAMLFIAPAAFIWYLTGNLIDDSDMHPQLNMKSYDTSLSEDAYLNHL